MVIRLQLADDSRRLKRQEKRQLGYRRAEKGQMDMAASVIDEIVADPVARARVKRVLTLVRTEQDLTDDAICFCYTLLL